MAFGPCPREPWPGPRCAARFASAPDSLSAPDVFRPRPLYEVFDPKFWHANYADGDFFKNKVVIVGSSAQVAHDVSATPLGLDTPGPTLHLHAIAAALNHEFLRATPLSLDYATVCGPGVLAWTLIAFV